MTKLPKIVGQRLQASEAIKAHPDPDLIAAFIERSLANRERMEVLNHLSRCADCRELTSLASSLPAMADALSPARSSNGWFSWPVLRWGAAAACVVVVTAAVTLRHKPDGSRIAPADPAQRPAVVARALPSPSTFMTKANSRPVSPAEANRSFGGIQQKQEPSPVAQPASRAMAATALTRSESAPANSALTELADARTGSSASAMVPPRAKAAMAESRNSYNGDVVGGAMMQKKMAVAVSSSTAVPDSMVSASLTPRWTLSADGTLQRSMDSGQTWETIRVSRTATFRALAANGLDIWVGGSAGAVFHSADAGQHWAQIRPVANGEALADDIIGVEFTDLLHGKLTTAGAEFWLTADAGQTWRKQ